MTNFIFKSPRRLIKNVDNTSNAVLMAQLKIIQGQNRFLRQDLVDVRRMLNRLLVDKHLQMQVDNYFEDDDGSPDSSENIPADSEEHSSL